MCKDAKDQKRGRGEGGLGLIKFMYLILMHQKKRTAKTYSTIYRNVIVFHRIDFRSKFSQNISI